MEQRDSEPVPESKTVKKTVSIPHPPVLNGESSSMKMISKTKLESEEYNFKTGIAVVINNISFDRRLNLGDRKGSDVDASSLFQRFQELGFDSDLLNDATEEDMLEKFKEIKDDKEYLKSVDCLIVALLTHGKEDTVYTTDKELKIKTVMDYFNASNCPELILKPKIFILQACRGQDVGSGVNMSVLRDPNQTDAKAETIDYDQNFGEVVRIPNEADFLAVYASSPGYGSFRNTEKGSPFVRYLSDELLRMKEGDDFYKVLTRVNKKVGLGYKPNFNGVANPTQMPCFVSHLTKELVLKPIK